jgi:hypothetical protein
MKNLHQHDMQQIIIYLNKQFSSILFPCENQGVTLTTSPVLAQPDITKLFDICGDAFGTGLGCVLMQEG